MTSPLRIGVRGMPAPQGSKRHVGGGRMVEMSKAVGPWREAVRGETQRAMTAGPDHTGENPDTMPPLEGALAVSIAFLLPRPKSAPRSRRFPAGRPDIDKLARAVLDGLTDGGAWLDDGQVVKLQLGKFYAEAGDTPGCRIVITSAL